MPTPIEAGPPATWQDLEAAVARILRESGYDVEVQKHVALARGDATIDVWADEHTSPPNVIAVECKHWKTAVAQREVHAFRTVVGDSGANTGLLVSSTGFQSGAVKAAAYSNVRLLDWLGFEETFVQRWFRNYMRERIGADTDPLHEYTEPINSRIFRKADALPKDRREAFKTLRKKHFALAATNFLFYPVVVDRLLRTEPMPPPALPLRMDDLRPDLADLFAEIPDDVLDAPALRPLMDALIVHSQQAIAEFDEIFGERA